MDCLVSRVQVGTKLQLPWLSNFKKPACQPPPPLAPPFRDSSDIKLVGFNCVVGVGRYYIIQHYSLSVRIKPGILGFEDTFVGQVINKKLTLYLYALHHIPLMHE